MTVHRQVDQHVVVPVHEEQLRTCIHRYQEGPAVADAPLCSCGTFAIGYCIVCKQPVCGDCSMKRNAGRTCGPCVTEAERPAREAVEARNAAEAQRRRDDDHIRRHGPAMGAEELAGWMKTNRSDDIWGGRRAAAVPAHVLAQAIRLTGHPAESITVENRTAFGRRKQTVVRGWVVAKGNAAATDAHGPSRHSAFLFLQDGRVQTGTWSRSASGVWFEPNGDSDASTELVTVETLRWALQRSSVAVKEANPLAAQAAFHTNALRRQAERDRHNP